MLSRVKHRIHSIRNPQPVVPTQDNKKQDLIVGAIFVSAIALLLLVAGYVISRMSSHAAYQKKWEDYDDYGWA